MALDITLEQKGIFKKSLNFKDVFNLLDTPLSYGLQNGAYVLKEPDTDDLNGKYVVVFDANQIGRGFSMFIDKNKVQISLPLPCTEYDIELFYDVVGQLATKLKLKQVDQDGAIISVHDLKDQEKFQNEFLKNYLKDLISSDKYSVTTFPAALFPINVNVRRLLENELEENRVKVFSEYFESRQEMDVFYPSALLYQKKNSDAIIGGYSITEGVETVLPITPTAFLQLGSDVEVDWYALLGEIVEDDYNVLGNVPYQKFIELIDYENLPEFDAGHFIYNLTQKDIESVREHLLSNEDIMN